MKPKNMLKRMTVLESFPDSKPEKNLEWSLSPGPRSPNREDFMLKNFLKNSFEFTILTSAFLCFVRSPDLYAQTKTSAEKKVDAVAFAPSQVWLSQLKTQIQNAKLDLDQRLENYAYSTQDAMIHFVSEQVNLNAQFQSKIVETGVEHSVIQAALQLTAAKVSVSNFNLEAIIQKDLGFGSATLKLNMHCDGLELGLKNDNPILSEIKVQQGQFSVSQLSWDLRNSQIDTKLIGCKEVAGFDQILKNQIQQNIEKSFVIDALQQMVNQKINGVIQQQISAFLTQVVAKLKVAQNQKIQFDDKNNLWIYSGDSVQENFTSEELDKIRSSAKAALLIKKQNLETFAKDAINDVLRTKILSSKTIDGMSRLTCSRLIQTFVWPSLKSLRKCFEMKVQTQVQSLSITDLANLSMNVKVGAWASGEGHQIAYFESGLHANLMRSFVEMRSFKGQAHPDFVRWSGRSKRISTSMIESSLEGLLHSSVLQLKQNAILKLIQKNAKLNLVSPETILIEVNL